MGTLDRLRKLRKMSRDELRTRIVQKLRGRTERRCFNRARAAQTSATGTSGGITTGSTSGTADGKSTGSPVDRSGEIALRPQGDWVTQLSRRAAQLVPGTRSADLRCLESLDPALHRQLCDRALALAHETMHGRRTMLGHAFDLSGDVAWHRDPRTDYVWPVDFYADLPLYDLPSGVDVKYVWELNRHQFLPDLARAWLFTHDATYASRAVELIESWIQENPLYGGVNWTSALEVAMRAISWLWTVAALAEWDRWAPHQLERIAESLSQHATYLEHHLSYYESPYNHLIGEATGLLLLGHWLAGHEAASRWERLARRVLREHGPRQFHADGFCVEQACGYHYYTLGFLALAFAAEQTGQEPSEPDLQPVLSKAFRAGALLQQPDGRWPAFGDVDNARSIPVTPSDFWDFRGMNALGAVLCGLNSCKQPEQGPGQEVYWLLGAAGVERWHQLAAEETTGCGILPEAGYAVARGGSGPEADWILLDAGPLAEGLHSDATPSVAHGHADPLSLLVSQRGKPWTIDSGMPYYGGSREWLDHFRSAAAHNTLEIHGCPVARVTGRLAWAHVCDRFQLDANLGADCWLARAQMWPSQGVRVARHVLGLPGLGIWVADWIQTDVPRMVNWYWHVPRQRGVRMVYSPAESSPVKNSAVEASTVQLDDGVITAWHADGPLQARLDVATEGDPTGWLAEGYGLLSPGIRVSYASHVAQEQLVVTYLGPAPLKMRVEVGQCAASWNGSNSPQGAHLPEHPCRGKADIKWLVATPDGTRAWAAGMDRSVSQPSVHRLLEGSGQWASAAWTIDDTPEEASPEAASSGATSPEATSPEAAALEETVDSADAAADQDAADAAIDNAAADAVTDNDAESSRNASSNPQ
jgi:hypothetical protein